MCRHNGCLELVFALRFFHFCFLMKFLAQFLGRKKILTPLQFTFGGKYFGARNKTFFFPVALSS